MIEKRKAAAALKYVPERDRAPRVIARGWGTLAERIVEIARKHSIPIREDEALAEVLAFIPVEHEIPPELYQVVAEIFAFVYRMDSQAAPRTKRAGTISSDSS